MGRGWKKAADNANPPSIRGHDQWIIEGRESSQYHHCFCTYLRRSCPVSAPALVRLGVAGLDSDARSAASAHTAHRFVVLRHGHRASSLASVPADQARSVAGGSRRHRPCTRTLSCARARHDCVPWLAAMARHWLRGACLLGDPRDLSAPLSFSERFGRVVRPAR